MYHANYCYRKLLESILKVHFPPFFYATDTYVFIIRMSLSEFAAHLFSECSPTNDNGGLCA